MNEDSINKAEFEANSDSLRTARLRMHKKQIKSADSLVFVNLPTCMLVNSSYFSLFSSWGFWSSIMFCIFHNGEEIHFLKLQFHWSYL
jgi:hypothetical protein